MAIHSSNMTRFLLRKLPQRQQTPCTRRSPFQKRPQSNSSKPPSNHGNNSTSPEASSTSTSTPLPPSAETIPGPSWLWTQLPSPVLAPFRAYNRIQSRRPYVTQFLSSIAIYFLGDLSAQNMQRPSSSSSSSSSFSSQYDPSRSLRALIIGGLFSIPSYKWFLWLGNHFNFASSRLLSLGAKVVFAQLFFTPVFNSYFFGMQSLLSGDGAEAAWERIKHTVPVSWYNSCKIWPAVTAFSFTFVQPQHRSVFAGVVAIGWQTYLSLLNQRAAERELLQRAVDEGGKGVAV